jgi:hypothetical protein
MYEDDEENEVNRLPEDFPVLKSMRSGREVDLAVDKKGHVWVVYDKPFEDRVNWLEYDHDDYTLTLILQNGKQQDLGKKVPKEMRKRMKKARIAMFARMDMENKKPEEMFPVTVVVRNTGL